MLKEAHKKLSLSFVKSKKVEVRKTGNIGFGLFAKKSIERGEIIFICKGLPRRRADVPSVSHSKSVNNWIGVGHDSWVAPFDWNPLRYLNHSCDPNASIKGRVTIVALKHINKDEPITIDYSLTEEDVNWKMNCLCGEKGCRKVIRSVQFLPENVFKKYIYVPNYFKKVYLLAHPKSA